MRRLLPWFLVLGCGGSPAVDEGGTDATTDSPNGNDGSAKDSGTDSSSAQDGGSDAGMDAATDAPSSGCQNANDCKLFSSYCQTQPCVCIPLNKNQPNPTCMGQMVSCFVDPCLNKAATCDAGMCGVNP